jgi:hypothetical protein
MSLHQFPVPQVERVITPRPGQLIISGSGKTYRYIRDLSRVNWLCVGEDGKEYKVRVSPRAKVAPEGTPFAGPDRSFSNLDQRKAEARARLAEAAAAFSVLDRVVMKSAKDKRRFPHTYVIVKQTSPGRFKLVPENGNEWDGLTAPASLIEKA